MREFRRWEFGLGLVGMLVGLWALRYGVDQIYAEEIAAYEARIYSDNLKSVLGVPESNSLYQILEVGWNGITSVWSKILTWTWLHTFQNGFAFSLPLAAVGLFIYVRRRETNIPLAVLLIIPISLVYQLVNDSGGRMLFTAFPAIIALALVTMREIMNHVSFHKKM